MTATGRRTPNVAGDVALPVCVVGREEIAERGSRSVGEATRDVPGVEISGALPTTAMQPIIRGLGSDRVDIRLDGARNNFNAGIAAASSSIPTSCGRSTCCAARDRCRMARAQSAA